jgi:hypothetical protein
MQHIGEHGLEDVLRALQMWPKGGLTVKEAREKLWQWSGVTSQLTEAEDLCRRHGIILLYNPKAHPWLNPIEVLSFVPAPQGCRSSGALQNANSSTFVTSQLFASDTRPLFVTS